MKLSNKKLLSKSFYKINDVMELNKKYFNDGVITYEKFRNYSLHNSILLIVYRTLYEHYKYCFLKKIIDFAKLRYKRKYSENLNKCTNEFIKLTSNLSIALLNKDFKNVDSLCEIIDNIFEKPNVTCIVCKKVEKYTGQGILMDHRYIDDVCFIDYIGKWICCSKCRENFDGWK